MRPQAHRKVPQQSLLSTPIPCSEWGQLNQGELFHISWGNLCQCLITPTWKGFSDVSVEFLVFLSVTAVSCPVTLGINRNNLALATGLPCRGFLKANLTSKGWGEGGFKYLSLFWGPAQQQALILLALAFAADMVVGALLIPFCKMQLQVGFCGLTPSLHTQTMSLHSSQGEFNTELIKSH